jgi:CHAD domain-containing protein
LAWSATLAASVAVGLGVAASRAQRARRSARATPVPGRQRTFALRTNETAANGLRRIALDQSDLAVELLRSQSPGAGGSGESSISSQQAIHETRKALKRLRALMRLLEGEIGAKRARRERRVLRDAGRRLAGARDAEVMVDTLDAVVGRGPRKLGRRRGVIELREHLRSEHRRAAAREDAVVREQVAEELCALRTRVERWRLSDGSASRLTRPGLTNIYRSGRRGRRRARAHPRNARAMHKWRKHAKDLRYALEVLDIQDPPDGPAGTRGKKAGAAARAKSSDERIAKLAHRADKLGELLGEDHDLVVLSERIRGHRPLRRHKRTRRQLLRAISRRRAKLRKRAMRTAEPLYARKPERFVRRVRPR